MSSISFAALLHTVILASGADSYAAAHHETAETGRPLVVMVSAEWCHACQVMKRNVIPKVQKRGTLRKVAFAVVNLDRQRELGRKLTRGGPIPQLLMYRKSRDGWRVSRLVGGQSVGRVEGFIDQGLRRDLAEKDADRDNSQMPSNEGSATTQSLASARSS